MGIPIIGSLSGLASFVAAGLDRDFLQAAFHVRRRPIFRSEWDAWGHCAIAIVETLADSETMAWAVGGLREWWQDHVTGQDTTGIDSYNQAVGRSLAHGIEPDEWFITDFHVPFRCATQAFLGGRLRVGPDRETVWSPGPQEGADTTIWIEPATSRCSGANWAPTSLRTSGRSWLEVIDPGERGLARGPGRQPTDVEAMELSHHLYE